MGIFIKNADTAEAKVSYLSTVSKTRSGLIELKYFENSLTNLDADKETSINVL